VPPAGGGVVSRRKSNIPNRDGDWG